MTSRLLPVRPLAPVLLCIALIPDAGADLTLTGRSTVMSMGIPVIGQETLLFKGARLRRDVVDRGRAYSYIYDPAARQVAVLDHVLHLAEIHSMRTLAGETEGKINSQRMKLTTTPTGRTQKLQSWNCAEHDLSIVMPAQLGNEPVTLTLSGHIWLARKVAEQSEIAALLKVAESPDFFIGIPAFARASPAQAGAFSEALTRIAPMGMLCAAEVEARYEGTGPLVELARRVGTRIGINFEQFNTDALKDESFIVPANYRVIHR